MEWQEIFHAKLIENSIQLIEKCDCAGTCAMSYFNSDGTPFNYYYENYGAGIYEFTHEVNLSRIQYPYPAPRVADAYLSCFGGRIGSLLPMPITVIMARFIRFISRLCRRTLA